VRKILEKISAFLCAILRFGPRSSKKDKQLKKKLTFSPAPFAIVVYGE
jgi:hypothetical protein